MDNDQIIEVYEFARGNSKAASHTFYKQVIEAANQVINPSYKFLKRLKHVLYLLYDLENIGDKNSLFSILNLDTDNYVITEDIYEKWSLGK